jgi:hypothetical protein
MGVTESMAAESRVRRLRDELVKNPDDRMLIRVGGVPLPGQRTTAMIQAELAAAEQELAILNQHACDELAERVRRDREATETARAALPKIARDAADAERRFRAGVVELLAPLGEVLAARQSFMTAGHQMEAALRQIGKPADEALEDVPSDDADAARRAVGHLPPLEPLDLPDRGLVAAVLDAFPDPLNRHSPRLRVL